jgi:tetratricopeptide (TPR) repeat protein
MSDSLGLVFGYQGRLGAAVGALQDAVKAFHDLGDRSSNMAQSLSDLAGGLAKAGRGAEAAKPLEEALELAKGLKNESLMAAVLNSQGDVHFYQGDPNGATSSYQQAQRLAAHASDKDILLTSKMNLARVAIATGHAQGAVNDLRNVGQQADTLGRKYISVASSVLMAEGMIKSRDYAHARQELQRTLSRSEKLGLRLESARIHYLMGASLRLTGSSAEAKNQYHEAFGLLDEIRREPAAEHVAERYDLKPIYAEATQFGQ